MNRPPKPKRRTQRTIDIRDFIVRNTPTHPLDIVAYTSKAFDTSRQSIAGHMREMVEEGIIYAEGNTNQRRYWLAGVILDEWSWRLDGLEEHAVWSSTIAPYFKSVPDNIREIWEYGFTEMLNNAVDHSEGTLANIRLGENALSRVIIIEDDGIGIFRKIRKACNLEDDRHAVLELAKGKFTTDPANHTGEGIFFTSRLFDEFTIYSHDVTFHHHERISDEHWIWEQKGADPDGTTILLELESNSNRRMQTVFDRFSVEDDDYAFNKTVVPVNLLRHGKENLVSRSQAKRLMARFEQFKTVVLDFKGVESIGQAFADEIFRVFVIKHPEVELLVTGTRQKVLQMIQRALAKAKRQ